MTGDQIPAVALESNPGDVLVFNHRIKHSSWCGSDRRRMFTMNFSERYPDHLTDHLKEVLGDEARFFIDRIHGPAMVKTANSILKHGRSKEIDDDLISIKEIFIMPN